MATFNVNNQNDSGAGSLREAINVANNLSGADTIEFDPSLANSVIVLTSGELTIAGSLTINGLANSSLTIDGNNNSRVFKVDDNDLNNEIDVTFNNLIISGGNAFIGGGIVNGENLTINNSIITSNTANNGGGIQNQEAALLNINSSIITSNTANAGGGIENYDRATINIDNSVISNNTALSGGGIENYENAKLNLNHSTITGNNATYGGGIYGNDNSKTDLDRSTVRDNNATYGGGIYITDYSNLDISNSTISGNSSTSGGGIYIAADATAEIYNSTIANNTADLGGGIYNQSTVNITSTIVASNLNGGDLGGNNAFNSNGNNLIGNDVNSPGGFVDGVNGDLVGNNSNPLNPLIGILQDNGGNTATHALLPGSPAIDAGSNPRNFTADQRSQARVVGSAIDIGAYEGVDDSGGNNPTPGDDNLVGTPGDDFIDALAGNDSILGDSGDDTLIGGDDRDTILGEAGNDSLEGGEGGDRLDGGDDRDTLIGGRAKDVLRGGFGNDLLIGGGGNDRLIGGGNNDRLIGNNGNDTLIGGGNNDRLIGGNGDDFLIGNGGDDVFVLQADAGTDTIDDFRDNRDLLDLFGGLTFSDLTIASAGNSTEIFDNNSNIIAILSGIDAASIDSNDFVNSAGNANFNFAPRSTDAIKPIEGAIQVNFGASVIDSATGFISDLGEGYDVERGYGWVTQASAGSQLLEPLDLTNNGRDRHSLFETETGELVEDPLLGSLMHLQYPEGLGFSYLAETTPAAWEYDLENGLYEVTVSIGDGKFFDSQHAINLEGQSLIADFVPMGSSEGGFIPLENKSFLMETAIVEVSDGRLTLDAIGGENTKINYINIVPLDF